MRVGEGAGECTLSATSIPPGLEEARDEWENLREGGEP